jgi:Kef-type K+ transport system membrane component KefB
MDNMWLASALWLGLALIAAVLSVWVAISVALVEIVVGAVAGNLGGLPIAPWVNFLAGFGAILLTFLAGAEIDPQVVRKHFWSSFSIGVVGFLAPYVGVLLVARFAVGWPRHRSPESRSPPRQSRWSMPSWWRPASIARRSARSFLPPAS